MEKLSTGFVLNLLKDTQRVLSEAHSSKLSRYLLVELYIMLELFL